MAERKAALEASDKHAAAIALLRATLDETGKNLFDEISERHAKAPSAKPGQTGL